MDENERTKLLIEVRNLNVRLMSPYIRPPLVWTAMYDETFQTIMHQQCLLDKLLDDEINERLCRELTSIDS